MINLDEKDMRILAELSENANATFVEIGKRLNLHPNVIAYRISRMERAGIIKRYTALLDLEKVGLGESVLVGLSFPNHSIRDEIVKRLTAIPQVTQVLSSLGNPEGFVYVVAQNKAEVDSVISKMRDLNLKIEFATSIIKTHQDGLLARILRLQAEKMIEESNLLPR